MEEEYSKIKKLWKYQIGILEIKSSISKKKKKIPSNSVESLTNTLDQVESIIWGEGRHIREERDKEEWWRGEFNYVIL
jgi:hypothetical protein